MAGTKWLLLVFRAQEFQLLLDLGKAEVVLLDQVEAAFEVEVGKTGTEAVGRFYGLNQLGDVVVFRQVTCEEAHLLLGLSYLRFVSTLDGKF